MPKKLFVFSDGTWNTPEMESQTNIFRLATMVSHRCPAGNPQLVYYDPGVGSEGSFLTRLQGLAFGEGIDLNIQQLYTFLAMNYEDGDEIYLFGFSRGAYTVRSLAGMIHESGLVGRESLGQVKEAYDLYRTNRDPESDTAKAFRKKYGQRVPIKLLMCFDTVGALGLPLDSVPFGRIFFDNEKYKFHDTTLSEEIEHAIHILSIDEDRKGFLPTYMDPHADRGPEQLTQIFMPGYHSGVGGGSGAQQCFADNALLFLIQELERRGLQIELRQELIPTEKDPFIAPPKTGLQYNVLRFLAGQQCRNIRSVDMLHKSTYRRYENVTEWRPESLVKFKTDIENFIAQAGR